MPDKHVRIMIVEDEALVSDFILAVLENTTHEVVGVAETGSEALDLIARAEPDLALVDIMLRGPMSGLALLERLRVDMPELQVILSSGSHDPATRAKAEALKPEGFLKKPFTGAQLLAALTPLCSDCNTP